jgi:hypothetical protein
MYTVLSNAILLMQLFAVGTGLALYAASFSGYGWNEGGQFVMAAFMCGFLGSIPTAIRDRKFFRKHWGFGLLGIRGRFPFQLFPARRDKWLNPLGWCFMAILFFHFFWMMNINSASHEAAQRDTSADLRYVSLLVAFTGVLGALSWEYPPTEKPQAEDL